MNKEALVRKINEKEKGNNKEEKVVEKKSVVDEVVESAPARPLPKRRLSLKVQGDWFKSREGDLAVVTEEDHNHELGILKIRVYEPTEKQFQFGTMANIAIDTVVGTIKGLQIREGRGGSIFLTEPSRDISREDQDARWISDVELSQPVKAQVLSYVDSMLVPAE